MRPVTRSGQNIQADLADAFGMRGRALRDVPGRYATVWWQSWQRVTGSRVTVTGKRREGDLLISAPDLVAYRRTILCAGESVGTGIADLLPRVRRTRARGRSNLPWLSLYLKEGATRASRRLVGWAYLSLLRMGRSV
jgi:hypothetical protein